LIENNSINSDKDLTYVTCDLCGSDNYMILFEKDGFRHVECRKCHLVYVNPRLENPSQHQEALYDNIAASHGTFDENTRYDYSGYRKEKLTKEAASYLPYNINGRILDVGCSFGGFLKGAAEQGWKYPEGVEIAPQVAAYTSQFFPVQMKPFEETEYPDNCFDVIRLNNVIEHLSSPKAVVRSVQRKLRTGGLFVIKTPNFRSLSVSLCREKWQYIAGFDHIHLFCPKTITQLLTENGFKIVKIETKGTHITPKDRESRERSFKSGIKLIEAILDVFIRHTLRGHRLTVWAEKV
jgi:2-polyprenyl-3-methyl-5-hydroxy-6-metoxy-1,4-benzoquinol methylase